MRRLLPTVRCAYVAKRSFAAPTHARLAEALPADKAAEKAARVEAIRRREVTFSRIRKAVVPFAFFYGLFILRPRPYNFLSYLSQRRRFDRDFNALFPPLADDQARGGAAPPPTGLFTRRTLYGKGHADGTDVAVAEAATLPAAAASSSSSASSAGRPSAGPSTAELNAQMEPYLLPPRNAAAVLGAAVFGPPPAATAESQPQRPDASLYLEFVSCGVFAVGTVRFAVAGSAGTDSHTVRCVGLLGSFWWEM